MKYRGVSCPGPDCERQAANDGLCNAHYSQRWRGQPLRPLGYRTRPTSCSGPACERRAGYSGLCKTHRRQLREGRPLTPIRRRHYCDFDTCERPVAAEGLCHAHIRQKRRGVELHPILPRGNGRTRSYVNTHGYRIVCAPQHPNAYADGRIQEHRLVMAEHLGRPLRSGENVHHRNGDRTDNRIENLELWSTRQPKGQSVADKVAWARELLALYADELHKHPELLGAQ